VRHVFHKVVQLGLILASSSAIRRQMLDAAAVEHDSVKPDVNEDQIKEGFPGTDEQLAGALAAAKALSASARRPSDWVIGSDSLVSVDGRRFGKPARRDQAAEHLRAFSGRDMILTSAVALALGDAIDWHHADQATLSVRQLSEQFIQSYLDAEWPEVGYCVGVFRMEGRGVQLFSSIKGDHFTILGMPLLPLLGALRERKLLPS
jgi:septum formation protein